MIGEYDASAAELVAMRNAWRDLAVRWKLTWQERRALLPEEGEDGLALPIDTEARMRILIEIGYRLRFEDDGEMCDWLRAPSRMWHWYSPIEVMSGEIGDLRQFRRRVEQGLCS